MKPRSAVVCITAAFFATLATTVRLAAQVPRPSTSTTEKAQAFTVLHSFNGSDGANPTASLIMGPGHSLYGTTVNGGAYGNGTVFKIGGSRNDVTVLYSFTGGNDGKWPFASVVPDKAGSLYGTTHSGGTYGNGTVFKLDPFGNETVLHNFAGGSDGAVPLAGVILDKAGNLYGTTYVGGSYNKGTVFKLDPSSEETVLYSFTGGSDGGGPYAGFLITDALGNLYGTTSFGGAYDVGTVFKLDPFGNETVLHSFNITDGWGPYAGLIMDKAGNLYGTTGLGGSSTYCSNGCGTVFKLDTSGQETVLHSFTGQNGDGFIPQGGLVRDQLGRLFGITSYGGAQGGGIVFKLDTFGYETVLHSFNGSDGADPTASLIMGPGHSLYGTTVNGGAYGNGTVFKIRVHANTP